MVSLSKDERVVQQAHHERLQTHRKGYSVAIQDVREGMRQVNANITAGFREVNNRIDRLFLAILGIGAAQVGLLLTLVLRN